MKSKRSLSILGAATLLLLATAPFSLADPGDRMLISVSTTGRSEAGDSMTLSGDGRYVTFNSSARLSPEDNNFTVDVYARDRLLGRTWRISRASALYASSGYDGCISRDGRYVAFTSKIPLVVGDTNGTEDVFIHVVQTGEVFRASTTATGGQSNGYSGGASFSADGRMLVFDSDANNLTSGDTNGRRDVFVKDLQTGSVTMVSVKNDGTPGNEWSSTGAITGDGRYVAFTSYASDLLPADKNTVSDVFIRDLVDGTTEVISVSSQGVQGNYWGSSNNRLSISDDGRYVLFYSLDDDFMTDPNLYPGSVFVRDRQTKTTTFVGTSRSGYCDASGRLIIFSDDPEMTYLRDQLTGTTELISYQPNNLGAPAGAISADGRIIGYAESPHWHGPLLLYTYEYGPPHEMTGFMLNRSIVAGQNTFTGTVTLNGPAGPNGLVLTSTTSSSLISVPPTITIPSAFSSWTFIVKTLPVEGPVVGSVTVRRGTQSLTATVTLVPLVPSAFQFTPRPVIGGQPLTVRMVMNGVAPTGGKVVMLSDNGAFATTPASVVVPAGAPQVIFQIQTLPVSSTKYVTITAAVPEGSKTAHFVIRP